MGEGNSFVIADIPGLIEGASEGVGLGHQFLRHVERCRMLIHIVDVSGSEGRNPIDDFEKINEELKKFNPDLAERPMIVAGNKIDMAEPEQIEEFKKYVNDKGYEYYSICAPIMEGTKELMTTALRLLKRTRATTLLRQSGSREFSRVLMSPTTRHFSICKECLKRVACLTH